MIGQTISHYKILEKLGAGGMGVVYKAEDTKLKRTVALKFLPPEWTRDEDAKARFMHEAQAASALDHNNICTIYEVDETEDGQLFIAMALYEGATLKYEIEQSPLKLEEAIELSIQIAQGLAKAHEKGIVHRDIKPANVFITNDGVAKILDFGLAKLASRTMLTKEGTTLGTVAYMSPEQAQSVQVDHRTDIWALGALLYEMISGRQPFEGDYEQAVMYSIMNEEPEPMTGLRTGVPMELERIVNKCLEKDASDRYQRADELIVDLTKLKKTVESFPSHSDNMPVSATKRENFRVFLVSAILVVSTVLLVFLAANYSGIFKSESSVPRLIFPKQVTSSIGVEDYPTWSPDGGRIAYESNQSGNWDIYAVQIGGGQQLNLTIDHSGDDRFPTWSPDGNQIAFWSSREGDGYFVISALGGPVRKVVSNDYASRFQWSKEGTEFATVVRDSSNSFLIEISSFAEGVSRRFSIPKEVGGIVDLNWSSTQKYFAFVGATNETPDVAQLWMLRLEDGICYPVTEGQFDDRSPSWSPDDKSLYFVSNRGGSKDVWMQRITDAGEPTGSARSVTTGIGIRQALFSYDGSKLAYSKGRLVANLWRIPILGRRVATWGDAQQLTFDQAFVEYVDISPDGKTLAFNSDRGGNLDLWLLPIEGGETQQITTDVSSDWAPNWSPDGKTIAFYSARSGNRDIWKIPASGGRALQLTSHKAIDWMPAWSPDGREIAFSSERGGNLDIWIIPATGGKARQVTTFGGANFPQWSLNGEWLLTTQWRVPISGKNPVLWRVPISGKNPVFLLSSNVSFSRFSKNGEMIYFITVDGISKIWSIPAKGGSPSVLIELKGRYGHLVQETFTTDGKDIYFSWRQDTGDIWTMDVDKGE